jgi:hypothetical protein
MGSGLTHIISIKGLNSLSCMPQAAARRCSFVRNDIFRMGFAAATCFVDIPEQDTQMLYFIKERNKHSGEQIVTAILS